MSIVETVLVFAGIPIAAFAVFAAVILGPGAVRAPRYRPGGPWEYKAVWYLPHPAHAGPVSQLQSATALDAAARLSITGTVADPAEASGGASGEW